MNNIKRYSDFIGERHCDKTDILLAIEELKNIGRPNPLDSKEIIINQEAAIEVKAFDNSLWLGSIRSFGKGAGTAAMRTIMDVAAKHNVNIRLVATPFGEETLNKQQLVNWYKSLGFYIINGDRMEWSPNGKDTEPENTIITYSTAEMKEHKINSYDVEVYTWLFQMQGDPLYRNMVSMDAHHVKSLNKLHKAGAIVKGHIDSKVMFYVDDAIDNPSLALELMNIAGLQSDGFFYDRMLRSYSRQIS
jgi:hypothetical protein